MPCTGTSCLNGGLSSCFNVPPDAEVDMQVQVNSKSIIQIYCNCSVEDIFNTPPRFSFKNTGNQEAMTVSKKFRMARNQFIAYRVVANTSLLSGENSADLRETFVGNTQNFINKFTRLTVSYNGSVAVNALPYFLSTAENPVTTPTATTEGLAVVGTNHLLLTQDPPATGTAMSYLPIGAKGITTVSVQTLSGNQTPPTLSALISSGAGGNATDEAIAALFPEESLVHGMHYFYTASIAGGTVALADVPHLAALNAPNNTTSPGVNWDLVSAASSGALDSTGALVATVPGVYLQTIHGNAVDPSTNPVTALSYGATAYVIIEVLP